ncbi:hypothetical protein JFT58_25860 [Pseudomonas sp. MF6767]|uniref:hypothetical protein n=1 Tax=Pseudomonas sp. MF6767 TaxID=2797531 RepID=UPI0018E8A75E|nr:hypothetical protein [Pseudomonas sp. MF6767]MBJ2281714.1 hypothetical protein [Pseudomonas sp. MF6767]
MEEIKEKVIVEVAERLHGRADEEIFQFFISTETFARKYAVSYELEGPMHLVLDNSIIQSFKHRASKPNRDLQALSYTAFTRFVTGWSDRKTYLAVTPAALYEHMGRRGDITSAEALGALEELQLFFADTGLRMTWIGFNSVESLVKILAAVHADDIYLTQYFKKIEEMSWRKDLKAPFGVKIPLGIAYREIPDDLALKYFDPWYVKFVLVSRIERAIIRQSQHNPDALPIGSGPMADALADLNNFNKKGALLGLGDIDMLQVCDGSRQYQQKSGYVLVGQTLDDTLADVLRHRQSYVESVGVEFGTPHTEHQIKDMVDFMFSKPFSEHQKRGEWIWPKLKDFMSAIATACKKASMNSSHS